MTAALLPAVADSRHRSKLESLSVAGLRANAKCQAPAAVLFSAADDCAAEFFLR